MTDGAVIHRRWVRLLPLGWLVLLVPVRVGDVMYALQTTDQLAPVPITIGVGAVAAIFGLTALVVLGRGDRRVIVMALVVLTFVPGLPLGAGWVEMAGLLGGVLLLTLSSPWSWVMYVAVAVVDATIHGVMNHSLPIGLADLSTNGTLGIALFAVTRLSQLVEETDRSRANLAAERARQEVLRAHADLRITVGARLSAIIQRTSATPAADRWNDLTEVAGSARLAVREAQQLQVTTGSPAQSRTPRPAQIGVPFHFSRAILAGILLCYALNTLSDAGQTDGVSTKDFVALIVITVSACGLQLYHGVAREDGIAPRWWRWTLALQWTLAVPATLMFPPLIVFSIALSLAVSSTVIWMPIPWSFAFLGVTACLAVPGMMYLVLGADFLGSGGPTAAVQYVAVVVGQVIGPVTLYALYRLPIVTRALYDTSDELAHVMATTQRLRLARDVHDLLGFHLSAITMNAELAERNVAADPQRAQALVADIRGHAEAALVQLRDIESDARLALADEVAAARSLLEAADVRVDAEGVDLGPETPHTDHVLGVVVREAVTNIVRHSAARLCTIRLHHHHGRTHLRITNDGAVPTPPGARAGNGLRNLHERATEAGGAFTTRLEGETFIVAAEVPT